MTISRTSVDQLYVSIYDEFLLSTFNEYEMVCKKVFKEVNTTQKNYKVDDISGLGMWQDQDELVGGNVEDPVLGYPKTYTIGKVTKQFQVSFEAIDDDEYALMKKEGEAKNMGEGIRSRMEYDAAVSQLYAGFSTDGPDGEYIYDTDHPKNRDETGTTYDNLLSGAFSHDNLETAEAQITNNMYNMKGLPIPISQDPILLYPPALRGVVNRVLNDRATERPSTTNRDINQFTARKGPWNYRPIEWIWLNSANGGSDTAWYILFPWLGYYKVIMRQQPHYVSWTDYNIDAYNFKGRARYIFGIDNWRGGFASTGV